MKSKNWLFPSVLAGLTIILMVLFKVTDEHSEEIVEGFKRGYQEGKNYFVDNLNPLFVKNDLSNEDVFNFAVYNNIPVDKENNKILQINEENDKNKEVFELKKAKYQQTNNYNRWKNALNINKDEQKVLDSLIGRYKNDIYQSVLFTREDNFIVNPNLNLLNKSIRADILDFAKSVGDKSNQQHFIESNQRYDNLKKVLKESVDNFIVFTEDSAFSLKGNIEYNNDYDEFFSKGDSIKNFGMYLFGDSLEQKLKLIKTRNESSRKDEVSFKISDGSKNKFYGFDVNSIDNSFNSYFNIKELSDLKDMENLSLALNEDGKKVKLELNMRALNKIIGNSFKVMSKGDFKDWEKFGLRIDSLANAISKEIEDSIKMKRKQN